MAAGDVLWSLGESNATLIAATGLTDNGGALSSEFSNRANLRRFCRLQLNFKFESAPGTGLALPGYILYDTDNDATFDDGGASVQPAKSPDVIWPVRNVATAQTVSEPVWIDPYDLKVLVWNDTGTDISDGTLTLEIYTHNEKVQQS